MSGSKGVYKGYVLAAFRNGSQQVVFFDGKSWGDHASALVFSGPELPKHVSRNFPWTSAVASVNMAAADVRLALLKRAA